MVKLVDIDGFGGCISTPFLIKLIKSFGGQFEAFVRFGLIRFGQNLSSSKQISIMGNIYSSSRMYICVNFACIEIVSPA